MTEKIIPFALISEEVIVMGRKLLLETVYVASSVDGTLMLATVTKGSVIAFNRVKFLDSINCVDSINSVVVLFLKKASLLYSGTK